MIQSGKDRTKNLERLYTQNYGLLLSIAKQFQNLDSLEDLIQEGFMGLLRAAELWDPEKGVRFSSFAVPCIRGAILNYIRDNGSLIRIPAYYREQLLMYGRTMESFQKELGRSPYSGELEAALGASPADIDRMRGDMLMLAIRSLQEPSGGEEDGYTIGDTVADPRDMLGEVLDKVQAEELASLLWSLVDNLSGKESAVVRGRFEKGQTLKECGTEIGLSVESVRRIEKKAIKNLSRRRMVDKLRPFVDWKAHSLGLHGTGLNAFKNSGMSSTERAAFKLMGIEDL